jgi:hypothetical protein
MLLLHYKALMCDGIAELWLCPPPFSPYARACVPQSYANLWLPTHLQLTPEQAEGFYGAEHKGVRCAKLLMGCFKELLCNRHG